MHLARAMALVAYALAAVAPPGTAASMAANDRAVVHELRDALVEAGLLGGLEWADWQPGHSNNHCTWEGVKCDALGGITQLTLAGLGLSGSSGGDDAALQAAVAQLARLAALEQLVLDVRAPAALPSIPAEWGAPGAFPRLFSMVVTLAAHRGGLPAIQPGALPALRTLRVEAPLLRSRLPPGWGATGVLPSLSDLSLDLRLEGPLPAQWAHGLQQLYSLALTNTRQLPAWLGDGAELPPEAAAPPAAAGRPLPPEWAAPGAFPRLERLSLWGVPVIGSLPATWLAGGFPRLDRLSLLHLNLTSGLPPHLLAAHSRLSSLEIKHTAMTGPLPEEWADAQIFTLELIGNSMLTGPAVPLAWLRPDALPQLRWLHLYGNERLERAPVPPRMPWRSMLELVLDVEGSPPGLPGVWCRSTIAEPLRRVEYSQRVVNELAAIGCNIVPDFFAVAPEPDAEPARLPAAGGGAAAAVAVVLSAAALAAAAGAVWRRRGWQRLRATADEAGEQSRSGIAAALERGLGRPTIPRNDRRAQLLRLIEARNAAGGIEMLPLAALPAAVAHRLEPGGGAPGPLRGGPQPSTRRQWGMATASMQLQPGELEFPTNDAGRLVELGQGGFGVVLRGRLRGVPVAVKVFELAPGASSAAMWREAALLRRCVHERVVPLYGVALQGKLLMLAMRLMEGGSLRAALQDERTHAALRWQAGGRRVALDVAEGLDHLHRQLGMLHGDLTSRNVLLDVDCRGYLGDLGLATSVLSEAQGHGNRGFCLTHAAPEQVLGESCTASADVYSLGVLLVELTTGLAVSRRAGWSMPRAPDECSLAVVALIEACLSHDPAQRPTAADVLRRLRQDEGGGA